MIKCIKSVLWRVVKCLSYIEDAWCLEVKMFWECAMEVESMVFFSINMTVYCYMGACSLVAVFWKSYCLLPWIQRQQVQLINDNHLLYCGVSS